MVARAIDIFIAAFGQSHITFRPNGPQAIWSDLRLLDWVTVGLIPAVIDCQY